MYQAEIDKLLLKKSTLGFTATPADKKEIDARIAYYTGLLNAESPTPAVATLDTSKFTDRTKY